MANLPIILLLLCPTLVLMQLPHVHIITPCVYPQHIHLMLPNILAASEYWDTEWWIVYRTAADIHCTLSQYRHIHQIFHSGSPSDRINHVLSMNISQDAYIYVLRDDTLLHPQLPRWQLASVLLVFSQAVIQKPTEALPGQDGFVAAYSIFTGLLYRSEGNWVSQTQIIQQLQQKVFACWLLRCDCGDASCAINLNVQEGALS